MRALFHQTMLTLLAHRLRSSLAVMAIGWGIVSVLVLLALGEGFYQVNVQSFSMLMSNTQVVRPGMTTKPWQGLPANRRILVTKPEIEQLRKQPDLASVSILYRKFQVPVSTASGMPLPGYVRGVDPDYLSLKGIQLQSGSRAFNQSDQKNHSRVAIIGWRLAEMGNLRVSQHLLINGIPFQIVGVTQQKEGGVNMGYDDEQILMPGETFHEIWNAYPAQLLLTPKLTVTDADLRATLTPFFARLFHYDPSDQYAMWMPNFSQGMAFFTDLLRGIQGFLGASGAMTLAVGALGVANIMFLSVTERTREIGVRLALGATPTNLLVQFLTEGAVLVLIGTAFGVLVSYAIVAGLQWIGLPTWIGVPVITGGSITLALSVTAFFALLASYFPARRASKLLPVVALSARA